MNFDRALEELRDFCASHRAPFAVVGGLAMSAYGIARTTQDVDIVVPRSVQDPLIEHLERLGYQTLNRSRGYSNHLHRDPNLGRIDVIYVDAATAEKLFAAVREAPGPGPRTIPVPSPEHLAAMKALAMKNDPDRRFRDAADVREILRLPGVDRAAIRRAFARHGLEDRFDELSNDV